MYRSGVWSNGKRTLRGRWRYDWAKDRFFVRLSSGRSFAVYGEHPEWGKWKLARSGSETPERG